MIIFTSLGVLCILRKVTHTLPISIITFLSQNMTVISSEFVKKGAERRERQVLIMVRKYQNQSMNYLRVVL